MDGVKVPKQVCSSMFQAIRGIRGNIKRDGMFKFRSTNKFLPLKQSNSHIYLKPKTSFITRPISSIRQYLKEEKCFLVRPNFLGIITQPNRKLHSQSGSPKTLHGGGCVKSKNSLEMPSQVQAEMDRVSRINYSSHTGNGQSLDIPRIEHPIKEPLHFPSKSTKVAYDYKLEKIKADSVLKKHAEEPPHEFHIPEKEYPDSSLANRPLIILPNPLFNPEPRKKWPNINNVHPSPFLSGFKEEAVKANGENAQAKPLTCPSELFTTNHPSKLTQLVNAAPSPFLSTIKRKYSVSSTQNRAGVPAGVNQSRASIKTASWKPLFLSLDKRRSQHLIGQGSSIVDRKNRNGLSPFIAPNQPYLDTEPKRTISGNNKATKFANPPSPALTLFYSQREHTNYSKEKTTERDNEWEANEKNDEGITETIFTQKKSLPSTIKLPKKAHLNNAPKRSPLTPKQKTQTVSWFDIKETKRKELSNNNCQALPIKLPEESSKIKKEVDNIVNSIHVDVKGNSAHSPPLEPSKENAHSNETPSVTSNSIDSGPSPYLVKNERSETTDTQTTSNEVRRPETKPLLITPPKSPTQIPQRKKTVPHMKKDVTQLRYKYEIYRLILNKFKEFRNNKHVNPLDMKRLPLPAANDMEFGKVRGHEKPTPYAFQPWERSLHESLLHIGKKKEGVTKDLEEDIFLKSPYSNEKVKEEKDDSYFASLFGSGKSTNKPTDDHLKTRSEMDSEMIPPAKRKGISSTPKRETQYPAQLHSEWMEKNPEQVESNPLWFKRFEKQLKKLEKDVVDTSKGKDRPEKETKEEIIPPASSHYKTQRGPTPYEEMLAAQEQLETNKEKDEVGEDSVKRFLFRSRQVLEASQVSKQANDPQKEESEKQPNPFKALFEGTEELEVKKEKETTQTDTWENDVKEDAQINAKFKEAEKSVTVEDDLSMMSDNKKPYKHQADMPFREQTKDDSELFDPFRITEKSEHSEIVEGREGPMEKNTLSRQRNKRKLTTTPPHLVHKSFSELLNDQVQPRRPRLTPHNIDAGRKTRELLNKQIRDSIRNLPLHMIDVKHVVKTNKKMTLLNKSFEKNEDKESFSTSSSFNEPNKKSKENSKTISNSQNNENPELSEAEERKKAKKKVSTVNPEELLKESMKPETTNQRNIGAETFERIKKYAQSEGKKGSLTSKTTADVKALLALLQSLIKASFLAKEKEPSKIQLEKKTTPVLQKNNQKGGNINKGMRSEQKIKSRVIHARKVKKVVPAERKLSIKEADQREVKDNSDNVELSHSVPPKLKDHPPEEMTKDNNFEWSSQGINKLVRDIATKHSRQRLRKKNDTVDTEKTSTKTKRSMPPQESPHRPLYLRKKRANRTEGTADTVQKTKGFDKAAHQSFSYKPPYSQVKANRQKQQINKPKFVSRLVKKDTGDHKLPNSAVACERNWYSERAFEKSKNSVRKLRAREASKRTSGKSQSLYELFQNKKRK